MMRRYCEQGKPQEGSSLCSIRQRFLFSLSTAWPFLIRLLAPSSDPHSDPNGERSGYYPADTVDCPQNGKPAKASESFIYQHFERSDVSSHAGGHWFESSSLHQEKTLESQRFRGFFVFDAVRPVFLRWTKCCPMFPNVALF